MVFAEGYPASGWRCTGDWLKDSPKGAMSGSEQVTSTLPGKGSREGLPAVLRIYASTNARQAEELPFRPISGALRCRKLGRLERGEIDVADAHVPPVGDRATGVVFRRGLHKSVA